MSLIDDDNAVALALGAAATAVRDDDAIDADQGNSGDNQANAVRSRVNQSDDDNNRRDTDNTDNSQQNVGNVDSNDDNDNNRRDTDNTDNSQQNVGNVDSNDDNDNNRRDTDNTDNSQQNVGNVDSNDDNDNNRRDTDNTDNSQQNVGNVDSNDDNDQDNDLVDFDNLGDFDIDSLLADALNGSGNDMAFSLDQTNNLTDNDSVSNPDVIYNGGSPGGTGGQGGDGDAAYHAHPADAGDGGPGNGGGFYQTATANGGTASMQDFNAGDAAGGPGHDSMDVQSMTSADVALTQEAFTMNLTLGANIQYNLAETSVVGGASSDTGDADDV
ncbi:hypothetical protein HTT03_09725 [Sulfitobacter sp. S0837]|uniref:hypothetical protein n=1 Tax=Sulfitobacter maritimus TaxID=2741719 RepID=UPI0015827BC6|nr:hypothetical protein [Sulfitobacter maritimus]NUH65561.1 hypothetical protein [Sulfitobacter maritimus]